MGDIDLINRDPNNINDHVKVAFEDVLAEPDPVHSFNCIWSCSYSCFECSKNFCYKLSTTLCGTCIAFAWGCDFAWLAFNHVWVLTPWLRDFSIALGFCQKVWGTILNCCCGPVCETWGLCFSNIVIRHAHSK